MQGQDQDDKPVATYSLANKEVNTGAKDDTGGSAPMLVAATEWKREGSVDRNGYWARSQLMRKFAVLVAAYV